MTKPWHERQQDMARAELRARIGSLADVVEVAERVQIGADGKPDESTRSVTVLGPATSADLLEFDAVPEATDSAAPAATCLPGAAPIGPDAETRRIRGA